MTRSRRTPPPAPDAAKKKKVILSVAITLGILLTIAYFAMPIIAVQRSSDRATSIADEVDDMNDIRYMVGFISMEGAPVAADGRIDVYKVLLKEIRDKEQLVRLCHSERSGKGPTIEQIRAGDYSNFPYTRAKGKAQGANDRPLLWDAAPSDRGNHLVGYGHGAVRTHTAAEFQQIKKDFGLE